MRIVIEIDGFEAAVSAAPASTRAGTAAQVPAPPPELAAAAAAIGAQNAGPAPAGPDPMARAMTQGPGLGAPLAFEGGLPGPPGATPGDLDAGAAPDAILEPPPSVVNEEDQG